MSDLLINTAAVMEKNKSIKSKNNQMLEEFNDLSKSLKELGNLWTSDNADDVYNLFCSIESKYKLHRYDVIKGLTTVLDIAADQYEGTESKIVDNASLFK